MGLERQQFELFFEMPPIIGDPSLPYKRAIGVVSADFGSGVEKMTHEQALKKVHQVVLRLPIPDSLLFHAAFESEQKFPYANLIIRAGRDADRLFSDVYILELQNIEVILFEEYHGDILVGLDFKKIKPIRGSFFLFLNALKAYKVVRKEVRRVLRQLPGF